MEKFDIYDIEFIYQEDKLLPNPRTKKRPVLILGEDIFVPVAKITGTKRNSPKEYEIIDWVEAKLDKPSYIDFERKELMPKDTIIKIGTYRGHMSNRDIQNMKSRKLVESYKPTYTYSYIGPVYRFEKLYDTLKEPIYTTAQNRKHAATMLKGKLKQKYGFAPGAKLDIEEKQIREISPLEYEDERDYYNYWNNKNKEDIEDAELVSYINGDKIYYKDGYYKIAGNNMTFVSEEEAREFLEDR